MIKFPSVAPAVALGLAAGAAGAQGPSAAGAPVIHPAREQQAAQAGRAQPAGRGYAVK